MHRKAFAKKLVALSFALLVCLSASGCVAKEKGATKAVLPNALAGKDGFAKTVYPFVRDKCVQCHGASQTPLFASAHLDTAYQLAYGLVNFVEVPSSKFVLKTKDGHCGGACTTDGSNMVDLVSQWKTFFGNGKAPGEEVDRGTFFTVSLPIPPNPVGCDPLNGDAGHSLQGSPDVGGGTSMLSDNTVVTVVHSICWMKMTYPLSTVSPSLPASLSRAVFTVDVAYANLSTTLGIASYTFKNPRVISPDKDVYVHSVKTIVNGAYHPEYGVVYQDIDMVVGKAALPSPCNPLTPFPQPYSMGASCVPTVPPLYSTSASASGILAEKHAGLGSSPDTLGFSFEYLQEGISSPCQNLAMFQNKVYAPIQSGALLCLNCHCSENCLNGQGASQVTLAGQRFNMAINDAVNNVKANPTLGTPADPLQGIDKVCQRFLQRSNLTDPGTSPIIVQPEKGLNGMPAQQNFAAYYSDCWQAWIKSEKCMVDNGGDKSKCPDPACF